MPPGAVSLDDVDLDLVSVDYVLNCAKKGNNFGIVMFDKLIGFCLFVVIC